MSNKTYICRTLLHHALVICTVPRGDKDLFSREINSVVEIFWKSVEWLEARGLQGEESVLDFFCEAESLETLIFGCSVAERIAHQPIGHLPLSHVQTFKTLVLEGEVW